MEALLALAVPAIVKAFELANEKEWMSLAKIVLAAIIGTVAGIFGFEGLNWLTGLAAGLSASGLMTVAGYTAKKAKAPAVAVVQPTIDRKF